MVNIPNKFIEQAHTLSAQEVSELLQSSLGGLTLEEAKARLQECGLNILPRAKTAPMAIVFLRQFLSPLIYILLFAVVVSLFLQEWTDAGFIFFVLMLNAVIGTVQEFHAQQQAEALQKFISVQARVERGGESYEIDAEMLVPGDIVLLESGDKIPADLRLLSEQALDLDESLLTGESLSTDKDETVILPFDTPLAERRNMVFAGTLVSRGRARGLVTATGIYTELGGIAEEMIAGELVAPPLMQRMKKFTNRIAVAYLGVILLLSAISILQGAAIYHIFLLAVALAVAAIPEGLPVAITIALSVGMSRMAKHNVIVRRLVAAETLGSCTFIAADKTGTLTVNELTARCLQLADGKSLNIGGRGMSPVGEVEVEAEYQDVLKRLAEASVFCNEAYLGRRNAEWVHHGDAVDVALLVLGHKAGVLQAPLLEKHPELGTIPFESERLFAAALNKSDNHNIISVKGATEQLLPMCNRMATRSGDVAIDSLRLQAQADELARQGYRVLAVAEGRVPSGNQTLAENQLRDLTFLGIIGMIDPPREEAAEAIAACRRAGIEFSMITGDHPVTALAVSRELGLAQHAEQVVTGQQLKLAQQQGDSVFDDLVFKARVFARIEPRDKVTIVESLQRNGEFVAVTGDGANDAPALKTAHVGVAMGKKGTDVARESADLIITDDNIASLVDGVRQGRIAYANVRKVIFLLISTGAVEIVIFLLSLLAGLPLPLTAIQLLWLNLVTEGIQHIGLAFEPAEGDEMIKKPRPPREPIFNRIMIERVLISAVVMGTLAFAVFWWLLKSGLSVEDARNSTLLLMVLFENVQVFNSRSETLSAFRHNPMRNRLLLFGTIGAQLIHIGALYTPGLSNILQAHPVSLSHWLVLLLMASTILIVIEFHKLILKKRNNAE